MDEPKVKVWRINDYEWWAAESFNELVGAYTRETGLTYEEAFEEPRQITNEEMDRLSYYVQDGEFKGVKEGNITFRQALGLMLDRGCGPEPFCFAGTEW